MIVGTERLRGSPGVQENRNLVKSQGGDAKSIDAPEPAHIPNVVGSGPAAATALNAEVRRPLDLGF